MKTGARLSAIAVAFSSLLLFSMLAADAATVTGRKVTLILSQPTHAVSWAAIYAAQGLDFFSQEGIQVSLEMSRGTGDSVILLSAGKGETAQTSLDAIMLAASKGADIVSFFTYWEGDLNRFVVLDSSPFTMMTDLKGKDIGIPFLGGTSHYLVLRELSLAGMKQDDVNLVAVGMGPAAIETLIQGKVSALMTPSYGSLIYLSQVRKIKMRIIAQKAKPVPTLIFATSRNMLRSDRNMLVGFARAVTKGIVYTMANSSAAIDVMAKLYPEIVTDRNYTKINTDFLNSCHISEAGKTRPIGWHDPEAWAAAQTLYEDAGILPKGVSITSLYTNDLLDEANNFDKAAIQQMAISSGMPSSQRTFMDPRIMILLAVTLLASLGIGAILIRRFLRKRSN